MANNNPKIEKEKEYVGVVRENNDPNHAGRCQIYVADIMDGLDILPWATPGNTSIYAGNGGGNLSVPKIGTVVKVRFKDGDFKSPEYYGVQKIDQNLVNEIKEDYDGAQVLMYDHDEDLSIMFTRNSGLTFYYKGSYVQLTPDGMITICHAGNQSIIQLQGNKTNIVSKNEININAENTINIKGKIINLEADHTYIKSDVGIAPEFAVNGNELVNFLLNLATAVDSKYPPSPMANAGNLQSMKNKILNTKLKYV